VKDWLVASVLPAEWSSSLRVLAGDSDRSSKDPAMYVSIMDSFDIHGLFSDSKGRVGATELRKGTSTDSSISS
jgi:hypothetical protein